MSFLSFDQLVKALNFEYKTSIEFSSTPADLYPYLAASKTIRPSPLPKSMSSTWLDLFGTYFGSATDLLNARMALKALLTFGGN
jgi:hypothetical protein